MEKEKRLFIITLEKIEKRYTKQWYYYWKEEFGKYFDYVENIDGTHISDKIKTGRFLDINQTNIWKAEQTIKLANMFKEGKIKVGDRFIFMDGWNPTITSLKYMSQLNKIPIKIFAYWHAGTWDDNDFITQAGMRKWACMNEAGWLRACNKNFVATQYHKHLIEDYFAPTIPDNIRIVGFPMDWEKEIEKEIGKQKVEKENIVVFPHRADPEKNPEMFDKLAKEFPEYKFIKTMEVTETKKQYYELLSKARVVFSANKQETFGIGTVEGMCLGCIPLVPNKLSYKEMYNKEFKYNNDTDMYNKLRKILSKDSRMRFNKVFYENKKKLIKQSLKSIKKMAEVMLR